MIKWGEGDDYMTSPHFDPCFVGWLWGGLLLWGGLSGSPSKSMRQAILRRLEGDRRTGTRGETTSMGRIDWDTFGLHYIDG